MKEERKWGIRNDTNKEERKMIKEGREEVGNKK